METIIKIRFECHVAPYEIYISFIFKQLSDKYSIELIKPTVVIPNKHKTNINRKIEIQGINQYQYIQAYNANLPEKCPLIR